MMAIRFGACAWKSSQRHREKPARGGEAALASDGYLHAASVIALADTSAGYGCAASPPEGAKGFTTIELKANFLGTARDGTVSYVATAEYLGRTTQVWSATVTDAAGKTLMLFRCAQMLLC